MPHLRIRSVANDDIQKLSETLIPKLAELLNSPSDNFTLEKIASDFYQEGQKISSYPFVEVLWFARPQEEQDKVARLITDYLRAATGSVDIIVVFHVLNKTAYYENGTHF